MLRMFLLVSLMLKNCPRLSTLSFFRFYSSASEWGRGYHRHHPICIVFDPLSWVVNIELAEFVTGLWAHVDRAPLKGLSNDILSDFIDWVFMEGGTSAKSTSPAIDLFRSVSLFEANMHAITSITPSAFPFSKSGWPGSTTVHFHESFTFSNLTLPCSIRSIPRLRVLKIVFLNTCPGQEMNGVCRWLSPRLQQSQETRL